MEAKVEQGKMGMETCEWVTQLETVKLTCTERVYSEGDEPSGSLGKSISGCVPNHDVEVCLSCCRESKEVKVA